MTVRAAEALVQILRQGKGVQKPFAPASKDPDIRRLENAISERLGAPVIIRHGSKGAGQVIIKYSTLDELDGVLGRFQKDFDH
jgi:ParB family chromosome partitioning protein